MCRVAVVTGSNKGIGYAIVESLSQVFDGIVYLTARSEKLGLEAVNKLTSSTEKRVHREVRFFQLDITDRGSIAKLRDHLLKEHGGLDVLVNNAGIAYKHASTAPFSEQAEVTLATNYFGTKMVCAELFPILKPHARVVNVCSTSGLLKILTDKQIQLRLLSPDLTIDQLDAIVNQFIEYAKAGTHIEHGFPHTAYGMSKLAEIALTRIQQRLLETRNADIIVNGCCPGYVDTDMTSHKGPLTPKQGAETPVYLAVLPPDVKQPKGEFIFQKKVIDWMTGNATEAQ